MGTTTTLANSIPELPVSQDLNDPTGFPDDTRTKATRSFVDGTRTFTLTPVGTDYHWWLKGKEYISTVAQSIEISDVNGFHVIYEDADGDLAEVVNPSRHATGVAIRTLPLVAILYWNGVLAEAIYQGEERHGIQMSGSVHSFLHFRDGLAWFGGLGLTDISADGGGALADAQVGVLAGTVSDEDLHFYIADIASTVGLPVFYQIGAEATPLWYRTFNAGFFSRTVDNTDATLNAYNFNNAGTWELKSPGTGDFMCYHLFATTDPDQPIISYMGIADYSNKLTARAGALAEVKELALNRTLSPEVFPIASIIVQTKTTYANDANIRVISTDDGNAYEDWREELINHIPKVL